MVQIKPKRMYMNLLVQHHGLCSIKREISNFLTDPHILWMAMCQNAEWNDSDYKSIRSIIMSTIGACSNVIDEYGINYDMGGLKKLDLMADSEAFKDVARSAYFMFELMQSSINQQLNSISTLLSYTSYGTTLGLITKEEKNKQIIKNKSNKW